MNIDLPSEDDSLIRQLWLSNYITPTISASLELGLFEVLAHEPLGLQAIADHLQLHPDAIEVLTSILSSVELLKFADQDFSLTPISRNYLLKDSPYYWGNMFMFVKDVCPNHDSMLIALRKKKPNAMETGIALTTEWEENVVSLERARTIAIAMNSLSQTVAVALAKKITLPNHYKMLDIGGGSGCFATAFAREFPSASFTIADLPNVCLVAQEFIELNQMQERIDTYPLDMFQDAWPINYDFLFMANILHDWDAMQCQKLLKKAKSSLKKGGEILICEMLIDENQNGPINAGLFSAAMIYLTKGKQFRASELEQMLTAANFSEVHIEPIYSGYSLIRAKA